MIFSLFIVLKTDFYEMYSEQHAAEGHHPNLVFFFFWYSLTNGFEVAVRLCKMEVNSVKHDLLVVLFFLLFRHVRLFNPLTPNGH